ncbi:MAG TPA: gamma-glutamylcyclotransferase family protein [Pseudolabrys sp.]|nr:gamma-glutamylcyclotransferase family protein [Pseudolabrys sp.]
MTPYFAYGANMDRAAMQRRCPDARAIGPSSLPGFRFFVGSDGWGSVAPRPGATVHGVLWRLTPRDIAILHAFEWRDKGLYDVRFLPVRHGTRIVPAMVYVLRRREIGRPKPGYVEAIAAAARKWRLPERYIASVERWAVSGFAGARPVDIGDVA